MPQAHHHGVRAFLQFGFAAGNHDDVGFGGEDFFRIDRTVELDRRSGDIVAADQRRHRTPHALAEGYAVFRRAFVAELDIHLGLGRLAFCTRAWMVSATRL